MPYIKKSRSRHDSATYTKDTTTDENAPSLISTVIG